CFFSSRRRHTRSKRDWSSDVCSSDLQLKEVGTDVSQFIAELVEFFGASYMKERNYPGPPMHDPLAVAAVADPSVVRTIRAPIYVETQGAHARGQTDRKSTRLNSSHGSISYSVFCLKKKKTDRPI